jgi:copper chaperone CopZ
MARTTVKILNISCDHCASTIKRELAGVRGVSLVEVDLRTREVSVEWDTPARWEDIRQLLHDINYPPEELSNSRGASTDG